MNGKATLTHIGLERGEETSALVLEWSNGKYNCITLGNCGPISVYIALARLAKSVARDENSGRLDD